MVYAVAEDKSRTSFHAVFKHYTSWATFSAPLYYSLVLGKLNWRVSSLYSLSLLFPLKPSSIQLPIPQFLKNWNQLIVTFSCSVWCNSVQYRKCVVLVCTLPVSSFLVYQVLHSLPSSASPSWTLRFFVCLFVELTRPSPVSLLSPYTL